MKRVFIVFVVSFVVLLGFIALAPRQENRASQDMNLPSYIETLMEDASIPGLAIAVIADGKIRHLQGYGYANIESGHRMTADTPANIASISKPIMGMAIMSLVADGLLNLDADVSDYLPFPLNNPHTNGAAISLRNLATHTSGLADYYDEDSYTEGADAVVSLEDHLRRLLLPGGDLYEGAAYFSENPPGSSRLYSNLGAGVAGLATEYAVGRSLEQISRQRIFAPLGMDQTSWRIDYYPSDVLATRYEVQQCIWLVGICATANEPVLHYLISRVFNPGKSLRSYHTYPHFGNPQYPDGGVNASVRDLASMALMLLNQGEYEGKRILDEASFAEMMRLQLPPELSSRQRFFWRDRETLGFTGHSGSDLGVFSSFMFNPENKSAVIIIMNRSPVGSTMAAISALSSRLLQEYVER